MKDNVRQPALNELRVVEQAPLPAIRASGVAPTAVQAGVRWTVALVWFMRTIAVVWIAKGLFCWTLVLGIHQGVADFLDLPPAIKAMICFFAVADLLAAVGLWLAASWGGVLWLICAATEIIAVTLGGGASLTGTLGALLNAVLICVYFALSWLAANERP
jgi:hypothetical protein